MCLIVALLLQASEPFVDAFMVRTPPLRHAKQSFVSPRTYAMARLMTSRLSTHLKLAATSSPPDKMKAREIREELESYGINTKSFLEKSELVDALTKARAEGKKPIEKETTKTSSDVNGKQDPTSSAGSSSRAEKIAAEKQKAKSMKVGELKKALQDMGISTKSFFEKSEFVQAYAEALVDGRSKKKAGKQGTAKQDEPFDPSYRDVVMQKFNSRALGSGKVIDVTLAR